MAAASKNRIHLRMGPNKMLLPADDAAKEALDKFKVGMVLAVEVKEQHNYQFLRKMMALFKLAYDHFCEYNLSETYFREVKVVPEFDRFRKDLTILAGHYTPVFSIKGEIRLEAKSLSFAKASNEDREKIFSDVLNAALNHVYKAQLDERTLRHLVEEYIRFM